MRSWLEAARTYARPPLPMTRTSVMRPFNALFVRVGTLLTACGYGASFLFSMHFRTLGGNDLDTGEALAGAMVGTFVGVRSRLVRSARRGRAHDRALGAVRRPGCRRFRLHRAPEPVQPGARVPDGLRLGHILSGRADVAGRAHKRRGSRPLVSSPRHVPDDRHERRPGARGAHHSLLALDGQRRALRDRRTVRDRGAHAGDLRPGHAAHARRAGAGTMAARQQRDLRYAPPIRLS